MSRRKTQSLDEQLAELGQAVIDAKTRARAVRHQQHLAEGEVRRLSEARVEAFAASDEPLADRLQAERLKPEATVRELQERVAGADLAIQRAEAERAQFATHEAEAIFAERAADADAAVAAVKDAVGQLVAAKARWESIAAETANLLRLAGRSTAHGPTFPVQLGELAKDARRAGEIDVPLPIPGDARAAARVVASVDP
jgi:hypothetical protein